MPVIIMEKTWWITIEAERVLYADRGRDIILCDRQRHENETLVIRLTEAARQKLIDELKS